MLLIQSVKKEREGKSVRQVTVAIWFRVWGSLVFINSLSDWQVRTK